MSKVRSVSTSWQALLVQADPEYYAKIRNETLYEFSNERKFKGNPRTTATAYPDAFRQQIEIGQAAGLTEAEAIEFPGYEDILHVLVNVEMPTLDMDQEFP